MANRIDGQVTAIDSFGNLVTNITREMLAGVPTDESVTVACDEHETHGIFNDLRRAAADDADRAGRLERHASSWRSSTTARRSCSASSVGAPVEVRW